MISLMKVIAALLLGISVAALPANGHPPDDDSLLSLNDTLPANESLPLRDQPKREDWRSAQIWCYFEMKAFWYDFRIYGEGFLGREENLERKVMTAADRAGKVTGWKVAHYPPEGDKNSSAIIKFSLPILTADKLERKLGEIFHKKFDCQQTDL